LKFNSIEFIYAMDKEYYYFEVRSKAAYGIHWT